MTLRCLTIDMNSDGTVQQSMQSPILAFNVDPHAVVARVCHQELGKCYSGVVHQGHPLTERRGGEKGSLGKHRHQLLRMTVVQPLDIGQLFTCIHRVLPGQGHIVPRACVQLMSVLERGGAPGSALDPVCEVKGLKQFRCKYWLKNLISDRMNILNKQKINN